MTSPSDRDPAIMDADNTSRLSATLIWVVAAVVICGAATWPRWHNTPAANLGNGNSNSGSSGSSNSPSISAAAPGQAISGVGSAPLAANAAPTNAAVAASGTASNVVAAVRRGRAPPPAHLGEIQVPAAVEDWGHLNDKQHIALAPFVDEWARLPDSQKRKWLAIAAVYPRMSPDEQQRLHARMLRWVQMTPDERTIARENYQMSRVLPPGARQEAWRAYEALSPAQKAKLAAAERSRRRRLVVSALPGTRTPLSSHANGNNTATGAPAPLSTQTLIPLGAANNAGAPSAANGTAPSPANGSASVASQPSAALPSDAHGTKAKGAKGQIGNLNIDDQDRP